MRPGVFGALALAIAFGLFFRRSWAPVWAQWTGLAFIVWSILEQVIFGQTETAFNSLMPSTAISFFIWGILVVTLRRPKVRHYFQEHPA